MGARWRYYRKFEWVHPFIFLFFLFQPRLTTSSPTSAGSWACSSLSCSSLASSSSWSSCTGAGSASPRWPLTLWAPDATWNHILVAMIVSLRRVITRPYLTPARSPLHAWSLICISQAGVSTITQFSCPKKTLTRYCIKKIMTRCCIKKNNDRLLHQKTITCDWHSWKNCITHKLTLIKPKSISHQTFIQSKSLLTPIFILS